MSPSYMRVALEAARPTLRPRDPSAFFRTTRPSLCCRTPGVTNQPATAQSQSPQFTAREFSNTRAMRATIVVQNPRVDDDGNDMTVEISERAAKRLKQITTAPPQKNSLARSPSSSDSHLRVTVTSGGCHGFQYLMSLEGAAKIDGEEDTVFAAEGGGNDGKAEVVMDQASLELLKGSTIDFTTELIGSQFKIVGNPRAKSSCGCGTSFDID